MEVFKFFGEYFKAMRQKTGLSLRKFCLNHSLDPGNISRLERGMASPPSHDILERYACFLGIKKDSDDWYEFFDRASACSGKIPQYVLSDKELVLKLPLVFRTIRGLKLNDDDLKKLPEIIRNA